MPMYEELQLVDNVPGSSTLDMASLLLKAYDLGDTILASEPVSNYLYWKSQVASNSNVIALQREFDKAKELFEECQRFGRFHPNYHEAKDKVKEVERKLDDIPAVAKFKQYERELDELLHDVSLVIARSVSENIKVPGNEKAVGGGCGNGGSCSCGSGGCG